MKKLILISTVVLIFFSCKGIVSAIEWHSANQFTLCWDAVTTDTNGDTLPATSTVSYEVYTAKKADKTDKQSQGQTSELCKTVTLTEEGSYYAGVEAIRTESTEIIRSKISWADNPDVTQDGKDYGVKFYLIPDFPKEIYFQ